MTHSFLWQLLFTHRPVLFHTATWTLLLLVTASAASFAPKAAFMAAISPSLPFSCDRRSESPSDSLIRIPIDAPGEILCVPESMVGMSDFDFFLPTLFAAIAVFGSACLLKSLALWEEIIDDERS